VLGHCRSLSDLGVRRVSGCLELLLYLDEIVLSPGLFVSGGIVTPVALAYVSVCVIFGVRNPVPYQESRAL
jgi:hypothetical protein